MQDRSRHFRVGLVTLIAGGLFVGLLAFILGNGLVSSRVTYYVLFDANVKGMVIGSKVNFQGVPLGVVKDIRFADGRTEVEISIDPTRAIIQDVTRARLDRLLVTGQVTVELEGYEPNARRLEPGAVIQPKDDPIHSLTMSLPEVVDQVMRVFGRLEQTLDRTNAMLGAENQAHVTAILANAEQASARMAESSARLDGLLAQARTTAAAVERTLGQVDLLSPEVMTLLRESKSLLARLSALGDEYVAVGRDVRTLLAGVRSPSQTALVALRATLDEVRGLCRTLRLAPESLLYGLDRRAEDAAAPLGGGR